MTHTAIHTGPRGQKIWADANSASLEFRRSSTDSRLFTAVENPQLDKTPHTAASTTSDAWAMTPGASWQLLPRLTPDTAFLDPGQVTVLLPETAERCVSGWSVDRVLLELGIVPEKADLNSLLFLVTPGSAQADWTRLRTVLRLFEADYFDKQTVAETLHKLVAETGTADYNLTLRTLGLKMSDFFRTAGLAQQQTLLYCATQHILTAMTAQAADRCFVRGQFETIPLTAAAGRIAVAGALPYPPGIFVVVPGERWRPEDIQYFETLFAGIQRFPGFTPEITGVDSGQNGEPVVQVVAEQE